MARRLTILLCSCLLSSTIGCTSLAESAVAKLKAEVPAILKEVKEVATEAGTKAAVDKVESIIKNDPDLTDKEKNDLILMLTAGGGSLGTIVTALWGYGRKKAVAKAGEKSALLGKVVEVLVGAVDNAPVDAAEAVKSAVARAGGKTPEINAVIQRAKIGL